ncbi:MULTISPECIES: M4 family metallopeptidase [Flavobacterium]|uniref:M4 family metallopeptidase n=1 Tax=Flavobacterium jumunjinense TaxID=998845 RepID=A0ABV5GRA2_9FLAO|nr:MULTISPECIES: M4 family metallopeptidase [Flavobacterium]
MRLNSIQTLFLLINLTLFSQNKTVQKKIYFNSENISSKGAITIFSKEYNFVGDYGFIPQYSNTDRKGTTHQKFQQYYKGLKVEFGTVIVHSKKDKVFFINGELYNANDVSIVPERTANECFQFAIKRVNASSYLWENEMQSKLMDYRKPEGELVLIPNLKKGIVNLAYKYDIYATNPISREEIYIDANTGEVLFLNKIIKHANELISDSDIQKQREKLENKILYATGSADTRYSGTKEIETTFDGINYVLKDQTRGFGVHTFNCENTSSYQNVDFTDNDNNWSAAEYDNLAKDNGALDAHWGAATTYDFWLNIFGRNSFDDNGARIRSYVHFGNNYNNATWNGAVMTYGDGNSFDILTSIDVCGHEIGHAVCTYTANLVYQNESGAMNEGFSDIWGACIEHYGRTGGLQNPIPNNVWQIGEDISSTPLRSMSDPNSVNDPDTYLGTNWYSGTADSGGVHTNSSVLNHWFYILTVGESGTNNAPDPDTYNVIGIGMEKASEIAYLAERDYLTPNSTYEDARNATIEVVSSIYCSNSPEAIAVTNAWYAVNVGEEFIAVPDDIALLSIESLNNIPCSSNSITRELTLRNQGLNTVTSATISYVLNGSSPVTSTWNGNLAPCTETNHSITINGLTRGAHTLEVTTTIINDGRAENNRRIVLFLINDEGVINQINSFTDISDALISYDSESITSQWVRGERAGDAMETNGNIVYTTNLTANYPNNVKSYLVSQCYNLTTVSDPVISFSMQYDLEVNWDIVYVEYSTDFGANWQVLGEMTTNWYNSDRTPQTTGSDCNNCKGAQWTGSETNNTTYSYPLSNLSTQTNVVFRIVFHSDQAINQLGVNIDDFVISGALSNESFNTNTISIYPNPSKGIFTVSSNTIKLNTIEVFDGLGKLLFSENEGLKNATETNIDLTGMSSGIYFIKVNSENGIFSKRIVKE